ncbi:MAG TPA: hypothetical protein VM913_07615 [Sphingomicrobium sp.]|jgi:hypothetical protein|nr:hypothetical protein [Sphingomicrobium sp.]
MAVRLIFILTAAFAAAAPAAAPVALNGVVGGQWEVGRSANGVGGTKVCVPDVATLAQWEHRGVACTRVVLSDRANEVVIHYTCPAGDFGRSRMTVVTPRSLRIETQGIHEGEPFFYNLHARRTGTC